MVIREETGVNGNTIRIIFNSGDMGNKYKIRAKTKDGDYFKYVTSFPTLGEAVGYMNKLIKGGM